ncbi:MAG: hypothetical protein H8E26_05245 [FCB group bacterium]|nr:hypothetical protein [FCB group bacterium]MBL7027746.1 hypothetical protein [Candidatus Neomarinimicrobiota bacterium]MBL7121007.1 hypothetical protein [Candidatus Neomarinimicrobiota bacterium]
MLKTLTILSFSFLLIACPNPPDPKEERDTHIYLESINTSTTSIELKISVADTTQSWGVTLSRNDSIVLQAQVMGHDTTIVDTNLTPDTEYIYTAYFTINEEIQDSSLALTIVTDKEPRDTSITLEHRSTWTCSVTLNVSVGDAREPWNFALNRDGLTILEAEVIAPDTTLIDDGLELNTNYSYQAYLTESGESLESSLVLDVTTLDISSHDFSWTLEKLGNYGSRLYDVAIVNENNIWVVGNIETDTVEYNAAHWDGTEWELMRIISSADLHSVFYFTEDDIWVTSFGLPIHWDGAEWTLYHIQNMGLDVSAGFDSWGTSTDNMYFVGHEGGIVHYDGTEFSKMESGVGTDLYRVSGSEDGSYVFATGFRNLDGNHESVTLIYHAGTWETLYYAPDYLGDFTEGDYGRMTAVDVYGDTCYVVSREGLIKYNYSSNTTDLLLSREANIHYEDFNALSGQSPTDVMIFSEVGDVSHFNGAIWTLDTRIDIQSGNWYVNGQLVNNQAVMVGVNFDFDTERAGALIARGTR